MFNLSVADVECYYANDVLVHNCAWCVRLTLGRHAPSPSVPKNKLEKSWKTKLSGYVAGARSGSHMVA